MQWASSPGHYPCPLPPPIPLKMRRGEWEGCYSRSLAHSHHPRHTDIPVRYKTSNQTHIKLKPKHPGPTASNILPGCEVAWSVCVDPSPQLSSCPADLESESHNRNEQSCSNYDRKTCVNMWRQVCESQLTNLWSVQRTVPSWASLLLLSLARVAAVAWWGDWSIHQAL